MNILSFLFLGFLLAALAIRWWLVHRQLDHVQRHRGRVPEAFQSRVPLDEHHKAAAYTVAKVRFGRWELATEAALLIMWTIGGGLELLDRLWRGLSLPEPVALVESGFAVRG